MTTEESVSDDAVARGGWTTYDKLVGPEVDGSLWAPLDMGTGPLLEPEARTTVGDGVWTVDIPEFKNANAENQALDNCKHVILSTQSFPIPEGGVGRFAVELHAEEVGDGDFGDYRYGIVTFNVLDMATGTVFDIVSTGRRFLAEHELLAYPGQDHPFTRVVDDPFFLSRDPDATHGAFRRCEIELDRAAGRVVWRIDGAILHEVDGLSDLPGEVRIGIGFFTLVPIGQGGSLRGQGARASWRRFEYSLTAGDATG